MGITMASSEVCGDPDVTVLLQRNKFPCSPKALDSFWFRGSSSTAFLGSNPKLDNTNVGNAMFLHEVTREEDMEEDAYLHPQAKKRRLTATQVHVLEKHFEVENKLDPERKIKLAKELGLQPRQVAVWFQNRRARFKTKQLEKDCSSLRSDYDQLKADYERLLIEHQNLKQQVSILKEKLAVKEIGKEDVYVDTAIKPLETGSESRIPNADYGNLPMGFSVEVKQEEASSVGSELLDSERSPNPNYIEVNQIDEQEDDLGQSFYDTSCFRNSCSFGSSLEDLPDWSWLY